MTSRRTLLLGVGAGWLASPFPSFGQATAKVRRIGWFEPSIPSGFPERRKAFLGEMRRLGFVEGQNLLVDYRYGEGRLERFPAIAAEMVKRNPECLVAMGVDAVKAARGATGGIPIVIGTMDADPVKEGLVASLARPGGNITGMIGIAWELSGKRLELLREINPKIRSVAAFIDGRTVAGRAHLEGAESAAHTLKIQLKTYALKDPGDIEDAFREARAAGVDALFVVAVGLINSHRKQIIALANQARLPAVYSNTEFVQDGGLIGYAPDLVHQIRNVATYVEKILNGAKPQDLPIAQPTQFTLAVNLKTADMIGVRIPKAVVGRADRVIQ
jgi:putative tryptophan/tyrosine transport system substrate-binding protein